MCKNILKKFIKEHSLSYAIGLFFMLLNSYIQTLFPKILGDAIDILKIRNFNRSLVLKNIVYILLISMGTFAATYIWRNCVMRNGRKLECYLREKLFYHLQTLSPEFYSQRKTGDLIAYAINDISAVRMTFGPATAMSINGIVVCFISIYSMAMAINWRLTLMSLVPIPFIVFFMLKIGRLVQVRFRKVQENFASISDRVQENIYGIRVIKAYNQEEDEIKRFEKLNNKMMQSNLSMIKISSFLSPAIEIAFTVSFCMNLIFGGKMVLNGTISLGSFVAFNGYLTMILNPVISIGRIITIFQRGLASLKRLDGIFDAVPQIKDGKRAVSRNIDGEIKIKDLSFTYPNSDSPSLKNISLTVKKGHTLGIVGKTGSGKTSIANLLLKLYNIPDGRIFIDDIDINDYTLDSLRSGFGYVPQDNFLFSASIRDNITFFNEKYPEEKVFEAAQASKIIESILGFKEGFETVIGERGVNLSGGQKQRLSIARALIMNPSILILDDSLSAVDTITEGEILKNLKDIRKGKTNIIISSRISAIEDSDEIIVLSNRIITERGTHEELLKKRGLYYDIYTEQYNEKENKL